MRESRGIIITLVVCLTIIVYQSCRAIEANRRANLAEERVYFIHELNDELAAQIERLQGRCRR